MRTNGWTDMTKLIVAFRNFTEASKNGERWRKEFAQPQDQAVH